MNVPQSQAMQKPQRWPLVTQANNRSESYLKDARIVNAFAEQDPNTGEFQVQKRIGYTLSATLINGGLTRGAYTWFDTPSPQTAPDGYAVVGNGSNASLFKNGSVIGSSLGLTDASGNWSWSETQPAGSGTRLLTFAGTGLGGGASIYYSDGTTWTQANLSSLSARGNFIVGLAYLDGTTYFMDEYCQIFGSNLDDPSTWNALNVITAKKSPGIGIGLVKQLQYVVALKTSSMEVFYDGANPTGSPLTQIDGATNSFGCADRQSIRVIDDVLIYLTSNFTASPQVVRVDNLVPTIISPPAIERLIDQWQASGSTYSWVFKHGGHRFYGLTNSTLKLTIVYDIDQKFWYQWTDPLGSYFPVYDTLINSTFQHQLLDLSGKIYVFEGDYSQPTDNGMIAPVDIYTPNTDFETRRRKTLHRMYIRSDQTPGSTLYIRRSDDDYQNFSNFRKVDLSKKTPYIDQEGTFVKRAYHFRHSAATAFRLRSADLQMDIGTI